ncbi:MAG: ABC transporter ATP-binding protein [Deltaproteobacteria bacterium]|nr:ABC transporter ATP-binding protein [Deltaproteobacteria bacterium]
MSYLLATHLCKRYGRGEAAVEAVRDVSLTVERGEFLAVMGESGSGKSTLLSMLGALNSPSGGIYTVGGADVYALDSERRADFRRQNLGFVFQSFHLLPYLSVAENVMLPLATAALPRKQKRVLAEEALARVGLAGKGHRLPTEVSGGEAERAAIARALVSRPPLVLADEPTGNLDRRTGREVMALLTGLAADGVTIVMVTHSRECASFARRIVHMSDGRIANEEFVLHEAGAPAA